MATIISEFSPSSDGRKFTGCCTQASAAMCLTMANHLPNDYQHVVDLMIAMRDSMYSRGACGANGAATVESMSEELRRRGADIAAQVNYTGDEMPIVFLGPGIYGWVEYLRAYAGIDMILLQFAKTYNLASINPWNANVAYHAISVLGKQTNGYICGDPNRPAGNTQAMIYPLSALEAASPCGLIALRPKGASTANTPGGTTMQFPTGWDQQGDGWLAPASPIDGKRYLVRGGILLALTTTGLIRDDNVPIEDIHQDSDGVWRQAYKYYGLWWTDDNGHFGLDAVVPRLVQQNIDLRNQVATLQQSGSKAVKALAVIQSLKEALL